MCGMTFLRFPIYILRRDCKKKFFRALSYMQVSKCHWRHGISSEFQSHFGSVVKVPFVSCFPGVLARGKFSNQQKRGIISFIPRKGKDGRVFRN